MIKLNKEKFEEMKKVLSPYIKDRCNYCGEKITKDNFGLLAKHITSCKSIFCMTHSIEDLDEIQKEEGNTK